MASASPVWETIFLIQNIFQFCKDQENIKNCRIWLCIKIVRNFNFALVWREQILGRQDECPRCSILRWKCSTKQFHSHYAPGQDRRGSVSSQEFERAIALGRGIEEDRKTRPPPGAGFASRVVCHYFSSVNYMEMKSACTFFSIFEFFSIVLMRYGGLMEW